MQFINRRYLKASEGMLKLPQPIYPHRSVEESVPSGVIK